MNNSLPNKTTPAARHLGQRLLQTALFTTLALVVSSAVFAGQSPDSDKPADDPLVLRVVLNKTAVQVAEPVELKIIAEAPDGVAVQFPDPGRQLGSLNIVDVRDLPDLPHGTHRQWIRKIWLESLVSGELEIPALEVNYVDRRQASPVTGSARTPVQSLTILSTLEGVEDPAIFRDIKSMVRLPEPRQSGRPWLTWAAGTLGAMLAVTVTTVLLRRRQLGLTPRQAALSELDELAISDVTTQGEYQLFYIRLTGILRVFVQRQFDISAPQMTTREFLESLRHDPRLAGKIRSQVCELLTSADHVKFAGMIPGSVHLPGVIELARQLVVATAECPGQREDS